MALDFPSSPTLNQQFTGGGSSWQWDGTAWNVIPQMAPATASDTPPANPAIGQMWWRSTNGQLYVWYDDGNTKQWVQTSTAVAPVPGAWETLPVPPITGNTLDFKDLAAFKTLRMTGWLTATGSTGPLQGRVSINNGTSFDAGATDYSTQVMSALATVVSGGGVSASYIQLSSSSGMTRMLVDLTVVGLNQATNTLMTNKGYLVDNSSQTSIGIFGGQRSGFVAHNAIRLAVAAGSFSGGDLMLEGVRG